MLRDFIDAVYSGDVAEKLRDDLIGEGVSIPGVHGSVRLTYADYTASGRALRQIEWFMQERILPFYSNAHTEASYCGALINQTRAEARQIVAAHCGADDRHAVIFTGAGATSAINRAVALLLRGDVGDDARVPLVLLGPYEHHSNILPWRESMAEVIEIAEAPDGGPDLDELERVLITHAGSRRIIAAFSAASNVTGICTNVAAVNALLKWHGATTLWDFAGGGPYLPIDMEEGGGIDVVVLSPHKFIGGPGASGILIVRREAIRETRPSAPGGGTVSFVSPDAHHYSRELIAREEAGTPNVLGDIRAALAMLVKEKVGLNAIALKDAELCARAISKWRGNARLELLGNLDTHRLPIFSFRVSDGRGGFLHHQLITRMLSDYFGIQARGGCACAGPYAHRLLDIDEPQSEALWARISAGYELEKPGWTRLNFSYVMDWGTVDFIIDAVNELTVRAPEWAQLYACDERHARFKHQALQFTAA